MIAVSKELKQACNSEIITYKEYIVIDGTTVEIKGKMSNTAYKNTTFFGTFNLKMLEFTTENDIDHKKKTFSYYKSVNGEAFKIGTYIVTDVKDNDTKETVTVTAMDYGLKFAIPYTTSLNYASGTVTLYDVLEECCTNAGVELENLTITNGDFIVDGNQFVNGETNGTVVANVAGISCSFATINENDKLELIFYKTTETLEDVYLETEDGFDLITEDGEYLIIVDDMEAINDYVSLDDKRDTQPITCVSLGFSDVDGEEVILKDDDLIALYGENWLRIDDNYFAYSTAKMELLIQAIFDKVKGFGYSAFTSKYSFKPYLQLGDMIYFKNKDGVKIRSVVLKIDTDYDDITLSAPSITKATVEYEQPIPIETVKQTQILVDKSIGEIVITADKIRLEGYTTINDGFSVDLSGNCITNGMTANNVNVIGGNITLEDTGTSSDPTIEIYDSSEVENENLSIGKNLNGKTLTMNFPIAGNIIDTTSLGRVWHNTVTTDRGNYIKNYHETGGYAEDVVVVYNGIETHLYLMFGHYVDTNLTSYTLPDDFGIITAIDSPNGIPQYIVANTVRKKTTKFNSNGISVVDEVAGINTFYSKNGLEINDEDGRTLLSSDLFEMDMNGHLIYISTNPEFYIDPSTEIMDIDGKFKVLAGGGIRCAGGSFDVDSSGNVTCVSLTQTSKEEMKKNFEKFDNALNIINNVDIYKYHFKEQDDKDKKHIGFVIGDKYKYSEEITSNNNDGVDLYSMVSVCMKAIKEQQEQIDNLKQEIKSLKEDDK